MKHTQKTILNLVRVSAILSVIGSIVIIVLMCTDYDTLSKWVNHEDYNSFAKDKVTIALLVIATIILMSSWVVGVIAAAWSAGKNIPTLRTIAILLAIPFISIVGAVWAAFYRTSHDAEEVKTSEVKS